jgi:hypothetical protein
MSDPFQSLPNILAKASFVEKIHSSLTLPRLKKRLKSRPRQNPKERKKRKNLKLRTKPKLKKLQKINLKKLKQQVDSSLMISRENFKTVKTKSKF